MCVALFIFSVGIGMGTMQGMKLQKSPESPREKRLANIKLFMQGMVPDQFKIGLDKDLPTIGKELTSEIAKGLNEKRITQEMLLHPWGFSLIHLAAACGCFEAVSLLLTAGWNVNTKTIHQETPLHLAAKYGNFSVVQLLLEHQADPNVTTEVTSLYTSGLDKDNHWTPLHYAAQNGYLKIVKFLYSGKSSKKIDLGIKDSRGFTAQQIAEMAGHKKVANSLQNATLYRMI